MRWMEGGSGNPLIQRDPHVPHAQLDVDTRAAGALAPDQSLRQPPRAIHVVVAAGHARISDPDVNVDGADRLLGNMYVDIPGTQVGLNVALEAADIEVTRTHLDRRRERARHADLEPDL